MAIDSPSSSDLADALDRALNSAWSGDGGALDELIGMTPQGTDDHDDPDEFEAPAQSAVVPVAHALIDASIQFRQPNDSGWRPDIPGFEVLQELGRGGMATVWLARQLRLGGRLVALKVLPHSMGLSPRARSRFFSEARAIAKLHHPNIVDVYDVIESPSCDRQAYAMEWIEGTTLARIIEMARSSDEFRAGHESSLACVRRAYEDPSRCDLSDRSYVLFISRIGLAIARALGAVHRAGLVHRDVKPSNILLRHDGTPLLSDFGLVRDSESSLVTQIHPTGATDFAGTAAFAAPEQLRADGSDIDGRADIYALGVTLYSALALRMPYRGDTHFSMLQQIQQGVATPLKRVNPRLPKDLQTIIHKAMEFEPAARYQSADELADDLARLLNLQPIKAKPASLLARSMKMARRNRRSLWAAIGGGALALALVSVVLIYVFAFPRWSKSHLDQARLTLLSPEYANSLYSIYFWDHQDAFVFPVNTSVADRALAHYDRALRFAPFDQSLAIERDLVRLSQQVLGRERPGAADFEHSRNLPLTAAFASNVHKGWNSRTGARDFVEVPRSFEAATPQDLRSLGFIALLTGNPRYALEAWNAFDMREQPDGFVEAMFGLNYLISGQPGRAYPRLRKAVEAFPEAQFLWVYLSEAALECGDLQQAQHWLDHARSLGYGDPFNGLTRVQAALHAATGDDAEARRLYELVVAERQNVVAMYRYAEFLESRGDHVPALKMYLQVIRHNAQMPTARKCFIRCTERWWTSLSPQERTARTQQLREQAPEHPEDLPSLMQVYRESVQMIEGAPPPHDLPRVLSQHDSDG